LTVIINPLDVDKIRRDADQEPDFAFPQDQHFRIGFLGGLSKEKNVPCLIRAFADLRKNGFPVRLFLMGQGDEEKNLKHLSVELDVGDFVHFLGYRENPYPILKNLDVLVVPSFYEVFPYVILEAMACRVPVISAKWPGCEGIYEDGENCLLVQVNDHEGLAAAIRRLMEQQDVRRHLTENGLKFIQKCDAAKVMEQYEQLIGKCLRP
jgi:glycosyltransferase involved in cell wall biosynthesis